MTRLAFPAIRTARLALRALEASDAEAVRRLTDDAAILSAIHFLPDPFTRADAHSLIAGDGDGSACFVGAWLLAADVLAAVCGVHLHGTDAVEIGYWVGSAYQRRGLATEAAGAVAGTVRALWPDRALFAECRPGNVASWRLLETLGFRSDGTPGARPGRLRLVMA